MSAASSDGLDDARNELCEGAETGLCVGGADNIRLSGQTEDVEGIAGRG